jgi:hypothetical protein
MKSKNSVYPQIAAASTLSSIVRSSTLDSAGTTTASRVRAVVYVAVGEEEVEADVVGAATEAGVAGANEWHLTLQSFSTNSASYRLAPSRFPPSTFHREAQKMPMVSIVVLQQLQCKGDVMQNLILHYKEYVFVRLRMRHAHCDPGIRNDLNASNNLHHSAICFGNSGPLPGPPVLAL